ncbi:MAG TPA: phage tail protein [Chloroflexota bacterium]|jgi:phage tail-like protein
MDVNGSHYHLFLGEDDWSRCSDAAGPLGATWAALASGGPPSQFGWDSATSTLTLQPRLLRVASRGQALTPSARRGGAADRYGNWYWISDSGDELLVWSSGSNATTHFWSTADLARVQSAPFGQFAPRSSASPPQASFSGLAVTTDHYLVVGNLDPAGLWVLDLHSGHAPRQLLWPPQVAFAPFDIAARPAGGVWILDREHRCYWVLDQQFNICAAEQTPVPLDSPGDAFQPRDPAAPRRVTARSFPRGLPLAAADPVAVEGFGDDSVLILDRDPTHPFGSLLHYQFDRALDPPASLAGLGAVAEAESGQSITLHGHDLAFVRDTPSVTPGAPLGSAYVAGDDGAQSFVFALTRQSSGLTLAPQETFLPMRQFGGKGLVVHGGQPYYDFADRWLPLLEQPRRRYETDGVMQTPPLDGREPACVWHRLLLDGCIPSATAVKVRTRSADALEDLSSSDWSVEPSPYLRRSGSELPYARDARGDDSGTWELLFQAATGRYLQLELTLAGDGRSTPRIRALRAYYPRFSYLDHYLPATYRDDVSSASFLDRYLANLEGTLTSIEDRIANVQVLFDARSADTETLQWLASWLGLVLDPGWDERRRRLLIRHAMDLYQWRGTIYGLQLALRLVLEDWPDATLYSDEDYANCLSIQSNIRIVEEFRTRSASRVSLGDPTELQIRPQASAPIRWSPVLGASDLDRRYAAALRRSRLSTDAAAAFPIQAPRGAADSSVWTRFAAHELGFTPSAGNNDLHLWQDFLSRRYGSVSALNTSYGTHARSFSEVPLPNRVPRSAAALRDWYQFESVVLPMERTAHRFTVLLPAPSQAMVGQQTITTQDQLDRAQRLLDLEKPAHTTCQVKYYWAAFRVGGNRLGNDTILDQGSRAAQLMPPLILQRSALGEGYLAPAYPWDLGDRQVLGRDRLTLSGTERSP